MIKATREVERIVTIKLDLRGEREFSLPQHRGVYTVLAVEWITNNSTTHSHPVTAKAVDESDIAWTLSLRWSDLPDGVQEALVAATRPGDVPNVASWSMAGK